MAIDSIALSAAAGIGAQNGSLGFWANPYLWTSAAAVFFGLAAGQAARAFLPAREGGVRAVRRISRRLARAIAFLSLGILAMAALLVLADKTALVAEITRGGIVPGAGLLLPWAGFIAVLALVAGLRPLEAGLPLVCVALALLVLVRLALEGWLPLGPPRADGYLEIAKFLPYEVGSSSFRGHLELPERDSVSVTQELGLASSSIAISVESLEFVGPLAFVVEAVGAFPRTKAAEALRFYRVVGIAAPGGIVQAFALPAHVRLLDALLPLPADAGREPGGPTVSGGAVFGLAHRSRLTSSATPLAAMQSLSFGLNEEGIISIIRD
ncbi:MAG: hypothetical protein ABSF43_09230 [Rectinemataceae bacterium]|jgi:hypothetical protein